MNVKAEDGLQAGVIQAGAQERLFVDAGPGTGKTFVACSRVAYLVNEGLPASRVWIISFTRTAIHEIRNRLAAFLADPAEASAIRIATLDSTAWSIQSGFSKDAKLSGSHGDNIAATLRQVTNDPDVQEFLQGVRHLVVDEAQDIVGQRAALVLAIIDQLDESCGVTVFADEAQAIYGFTEDDGASNNTAALLTDELRSRGFDTMKLKRVRRTSDPGLLEIFTRVRGSVLDHTVPADARRSVVRSEIQRLASVRIGPASKLDVASLTERSLVLLRQRFDVLQTSSLHGGTPHRLRMSGLPPRLYPWIARLLWDHVDRRLLRSKFDALWAERVGPHEADLLPDAAWQLLFETAGDTAKVIDLHRLRELLGRANPPSLFTSPEYGDVGPVIGTIHASKGREAEEVCLYLPPETESVEAEDEEEEIRVLFVGATRAKQKLSVGEGPKRQSGNVNGRAWKRLRYDQLHVELGREQDLEPEGLVGTAGFTETEALAAQRLICASPVMEGLFARSIRELEWRLAVETPEKQRIAILGKQINTDLLEIAKRRNEWPPPNFLAHIRSIGLRTIAVRPDDPALERLHEPWRSSGFLFAPMLAGLAFTKFKGAGK